MRLRPSPIHAGQFAANAHAKIIAALILFRFPNAQWFGTILAVQPFNLLPAWGQEIDALPLLFMISQALVKMVLPMTYLRARPPQYTQRHRALRRAACASNSWIEIPDAVVSPASLPLFVKRPLVREPFFEPATMPMRMNKLVSGAKTSKTDSRSLHVSEAGYLT